MIHDAHTSMNQRMYVQEFQEFLFCILLCDEIKRRLKIPEIINWGTSEQTLVTFKFKVSAM